jgi:hypothetical protein
MLSLGELRLVIGSSLTRFTRRLSCLLSYTCG